MLSRPVAFVVLVAGSMTAAAGGAYLAMRDNAATTAPAATVRASDAAAGQENGSVPVATDGAVPVSANGSTAGETVSPSAAAERPAVAAERREGASETRTVAAKRRQAARSPERRTRAPQARERAAAEPIEPPLATPALPMEPVPSMPVAAEPAPQLQRLEEINVPSDTVIGVQVDTTVTSERARVEDQVEGHVTRDVSVSGRTAIPAGTKLVGSVTMVERGGKFKERARIAVRFHTAQLPDGTRVPLQTTAIMREGDSPSRETAAKVGGSAVGGAILGAILGGAKGAVIGGTAGAAGGTAVVAAGDRNAATLPAGTTVSVRLMEDVTITVER